MWGGLYILVHSALCSYLFALLSLEPQAFFQRTQTLLSRTDHDNVNPHRLKELSRLMAYEHAPFLTAGNRPNFGHGECYYLLPGRRSESYKRRCQSILNHCLFQHALICAEWDKDPIASRSSKSSDVRAKRFEE